MVRSMSCSSNKWLTTTDWSHYSGPWVSYQALRGSDDVPPSCTQAPCTSDTRILYTTATSTADNNSVTMHFWRPRCSEELMKHHHSASVTACAVKLKFHCYQFLVTSSRTCWRRRQLPRNKLETSYKEVSDTTHHLDMSRWSESRQLPRNFLVTSWRHARHARLPRN